MKMNLILFIVYLVVLEYNFISGETQYNHKQLSSWECSMHAQNVTKFNICMEIGKAYDKGYQSNHTMGYHAQVTASYSKFLSDIAILESRVKKSQINVTIDASQSLKQLEIEESGQLFIVDPDNGNFSIEDKLDLDSSSIPSNLTNYASLDEALNGSRVMKEALESLKPIVSNEIVWVNQSVTINGSCCMIANVTLAPGQQLFTTDLTIVKDNDGAYLDGEFTWGFVHKNDSPKSVSGVVAFEQVVDAVDSVVHAPSYRLDHMVVKEVDGLTIYGNVSFKRLELGDVVMNEDDIHLSLIKSLHFIKVTDDPIDLCFLNFNKVKFNLLKDPTIGNVNLSHLLTYETNQSIHSTVHLTEIQMDGSVLSEEHQFAHKLANRLSRVVNSSTYLRYNHLILGSIEVNNLTTDIWNDWLLTGSNGRLNLPSVTLNGPVTFYGHVNDLKWDRDLIRIDGTESNEQIDCSLIFADQLIISDDLASKSLKLVIPDNWIVNGNLTISGEINGLDWDTLMHNLVHLNKQTASLVFGGNIEVANCNFGVINDIDSANLLKTRNISRSLTFNNLQINELTLDQVNVLSCLSNDDLVSDEANPIDTLNIVNLETDGTINTIKPNQFFINQTDQHFNGSLITSNAIFNDLMTSGQHADCEIPKLNGLILNRLLRADPELDWPDTVILRSSNITNFTNPLIIKLLSNLMLKKTDQEIDVDFSFEGQTEFIRPIHVMTKESSINIQIDLESQGDIHWDKLEINGNLTTHRIYDLSSSKEGTIHKGMTISNGLKVNTIDTAPPDGGIYTDNQWKVHRRSTISKSFGLVISDLIIDQDLKITDNQALPWLKDNSLGAIEYYHEVTLDNLTTNFEGELTYDRLKADSVNIQLGDITNSVTGNLSNLQFDGGVTIKGDFTSDSDIDMNLLEIDPETF